MTNSKYILSKESSTGDAAVDGLLSGIVAGLLMITYLVIAGLLVGEKLRQPSSILTRARMALHWWVLSVTWLCQPYMGQSSG